MSLYSYYICSVFTGLFRFLRIFAFIFDGYGFILHGFLVILFDYLSVWIQTVGVSVILLLCSKSPFHLKNLFPFFPLLPSLFPGKKPYRIASFSLYLPLYKNLKPSVLTTVKGWIHAFAFLLSYYILGSSQRL